MIYALRNTSTLSNLVLEELEKEGQNIRKAYQRRLPSDTSKDYYFIHRDTGKTQPIIVEYGFLDSTGDDVEQLKNNYENYAGAVVRAVLEYIGEEQVLSNTYTVKSGDTLWSIAKKYGITVDELKSANNLTSNTLRIGQILKIPTQEDVTQPVPGDYTIYTVKSGDSLYSIGRQYNLTPDDIMSYNNLSSNLLSIGQQLKIPNTTTTPPTIDYIIYTVKSGDSLYSIGRQYNLTPDEIMSYNNLSSNLLSIGQQLKIPTTTETIPTTDDYIIYTVKSGDNLYAIGRQYGLTAEEIMNYNNLNSTSLSIGQQLKIPTSNQEITYVVKSGDNLYSIANRYNTTVDEIKNKNNLTTNLLSVGQILKI